MYLLQIDGAQDFSCTPILKAMVAIPNFRKLNLPLHL